MLCSQTHLHATAIKFICILTFLTACASAHNILVPTALPLLFESNAASNATVQAPYFRNVSAGAVWVVPNQRFDIGGRGMSCECFNPDETCCMPPDRSIAPFCISSNSSCCANTYCNSGESCCGTGCCPSDTNCTANGTGCCPKGQTCAATAAATCYDALAPVCTPAFPPALGCCPSTLPYCRSYAPYGLGCFASSTLSLQTSTYSLTDTPITHSESPSQSSTASADETTATQTITITLVALGSGRFSVILPLFSSPTSTISSGTTLRVTTMTSTLSLPSTTISTPPSILPTTRSTITVTPNSNSFSTSTSATSSPPSPHSPSPTTTPTHPSPTSTSTSRSALCFDPTLETDIPCPLPTTTTALSPSASDTWTILATPRIQMSQASRSASTFLATLRSVLDGMQMRFQTAAESCWGTVDGGSVTSKLCWTVAGVVGLGWVVRFLLVDFGWVVLGGMEG